jgi:hypothetical protein
VLTAPKLGTNHETSRFKSLPEVWSVMNQPGSGVLGGSLVLTKFWELANSLLRRALSQLAQTDVRLLHRGQSKCKAYCSELRKMDQSQLHRYIIRNSRRIIE